MTRNRLVDVAAWSAAIFLIVGAFLGKLPFDRFETVGFTSGVWAVWLAQKNHFFNWPIGLINSAAYLYVFWQAHLFADSLLQIVYLATGLVGWFLWVWGGKHWSELPITRLRWREGSIVGIALIPVTWFMYGHLVDVHDAAPFWDALTTSISLAAQYLLMRRVFENWWLWIVADLIYIPLYFYRGLPLTAVLYAVFLAICLNALYTWRSPKFTLVHSESTKVNDQLSTVNS